MRAPFAGFAPWRVRLRIGLELGVVREAGGDDALLEAADADGDLGVGVMAHVASFAGARYDCQRSIVTWWSPAPQRSRAAKRTW